MEILDCPLETPYAFDMGRKCCEVRESLSVIVFTGMRFKKLKPEWNPELDPDRTQVRIGSDPTNKRLLESILSVADKLLADQLCQGDVNFENSKLYVDTWFASYVYFIPLKLQIILEILNVQILKFFRNLRSSAAEDPSHEERKTHPRWWVLLNSKPSKTQIFTSEMRF